MNGQLRLASEDQMQTVDCVYINISVKTIPRLSKLYWENVHFIKVSYKLIYLLFFHRVHLCW